MRLGGMDKVKYYVLQVDRLLDEALANVVTKWEQGPMLQLASISSKKLPEPGQRSPNKSEKGKPKTEGLDEIFSSKLLCNIL